MVGAAEKAFIRRWLYSLRIRMVFFFIAVAVLPLLAVGTFTLGSGQGLFVREAHEWARNFLLTASVAVLMAVLLALVVARRIIKPLQSLASTFQGIVAGGHGPVQPLRDFSELSSLNESMMRLVFEIEQRRSSFENAKDAWSRAWDAFPDPVSVLDPEPPVTDVSVTAIPLKNEAGELTGSPHIAQDVTEQKRIQEGQALLAAALEHIQEFVLITSTEGLIQYANPALHRVMECGDSDMRGMHVGKISRESHEESLWARVFEKLAGNEGWLGNVEGKQSDGSHCHVQLLVSPVRDRLGTITHLVSIGREITHEVSLERQLRQAQKMEALGTLAGGIAHDFNNILTGVIGHAEMASFKTDDESPVRHHINQVLVAGSRAKELVKQILAFSRQTEQEYSPIEVGIILKEALKLLRASLPTTIEIHQDIAKNTGLVLADPTQVHQVLMNLCSNAAHAMRGRGGVLDVSLREIELDLAAVELHPELEPGRYLKLEVGDTGHGMARETLERIFDPFFTTKRQGEGTGMGLSVVYGIVKSHRGAIYAGSEPDRGSRFTVLLPIVKRVHPLRQEGSAPQCCCPGGAEHILLVDDEEALVGMGREIMQYLGYRVTPTTSSPAALELFRTQPDAFDLVVTDQTMPHMTGIELAKSLFQTRPGLPIILCTGYSDIVSSETAKAAGIREFLMKPYVLRDFALTLRRALDEPPNACGVIHPQDFEVNSLEAPLEGA